MNRIVRAKKWHNNCNRSIGSVSFGSLVFPCVCSVIEVVHGIYPYTLAGLLQVYVVPLSPGGFEQVEGEKSRKKRRRTTLHSPKRETKRTCSRGHGAMPDTPSLRPLSLRPLSPPVHCAKERGQNLICSTCCAHAVRLRWS